MPDLTPRQQEALDAYLANDLNTTHTAHALGVARSTVKELLRLVEAKGHAPWLSHAPIPESRGMGKTTVLYNSKGDVIQEWRRLYPNAESYEDFVAALVAKVSGKAHVKTRKERKTDTDDILAEIDVFDAHLNMRSESIVTNTPDETLETGCKRFVEGVEGIARRFSRPAQVVLTLGGDILHADNRRARTEKSNHDLDTDKSYEAAVDALVAVCTDAVQIAADVGREVKIVVVKGNHDYHSMLWLKRVLAAFFKDCPNVEIIAQESSRSYLTWGKCALFWAHGDGVRWKDWQEVIAAEFPEVWGKTSFRHLKLGHLHHQRRGSPTRVIKQQGPELEEMRGLLVEQLSSMSATDYWHAHNGYIGAIKAANGFEYHKSGGLVSRFYQPV